MSTLTAPLKLQAMALRFYQGYEWQPKSKDFYTSARSDLELYQIVEIKDDMVKTINCEFPEVQSEWPLSEFTQSGFGPYRVYVPSSLFEI